MEVLSDTSAHEIYTPEFFKNLGGLTLAEVDQQISDWQAHVASVNSYMASLVDRRIDLTRGMR